VRFEVILAKSWTVSHLSPSFPRCPLSGRICITQLFHLLFTIIKLECWLESRIEKKGSNL
jgi:hypothetical protein